MPFKGLYYDFASGEIKTLSSEQGEVFAADSVFLYVLYPEEKLEWVIPHNMGQYLPMLIYNCFDSTGTPMLVGVDEAKSDANQTTLLLTEPYAGYITYQIFEQ